VRVAARHRFAGEGVRKERAKARMTAKPLTRRRFERAVEIYRRLNMTARVAICSEKGHEPKIWADTRLRIQLAGNSLDFTTPRFIHLMSTTK
jgi:hypothetical protein